MRYRCRDGLNMTNHSYFNLAGHDSGQVDDQLVRIDANSYLRARRQRVYRRGARRHRNSLRFPQDAPVGRAYNPSRRTAPPRARIRSLPLHRRIRTRRGTATRASRRGPDEWTDARRRHNRSRCPSLHRQLARRCAGEGRRVVHAALRLRLRARVLSRRGASSAWDQPVCTPNAPIGSASSTASRPPANHRNTPRYARRTDRRIKP